MDEVEMSFRYVPGPHFALVRPGLVVVVESSVGAPQAVRLREALSALGPEEGMAVVLDAVTSVLDPTWRALPSFVVAVVRDVPGDVHVAARGSLSATVRTDDRVQDVAGRDVTTWVEKRVRDVRELSVRTTDGDGGGSIEDDGALPASDAVVPVSVLVWAVRSAADDEPGERADLHLVPDLVPSSAAEAPGPAEVALVRQPEEELSAEEPAAGQVPAEEPAADELSADEPADEQPSADEPADEQPSADEPESVPDPSGPAQRDDETEAQPLTRAALRSVSIPDPDGVPGLDEVQHAELEFGRTLAAYPDEWRTTPEEDVEAEPEPSSEPEPEPESDPAPEPEREPDPAPEPEREPDLEPASEHEADLSAELAPEPDLVLVPAPEPGADAGAVPATSGADDGVADVDDELDDSTVFSPAAASVVPPAAVLPPTPRPTGYGMDHALPPVPPPPPPPPAPTAPAVGSVPAPTGSTPVVGYGIAPSAPVPPAAPISAVPGPVLPQAVPPLWGAPTAPGASAPAAPHVPAPNPYAPQVSSGPAVATDSATHGAPVGAPGVAPAGAPDEQRPVGPQILARACYFGHANPPVRMTCATCGGGLSPNAQLVERPALGRVTFSHGEVVELAQPVIVGRFPQPQTAAGSDTPRLVTVVSPSQDVSRSHVEIRLEGWHVLVVDLDTVNGTTLRREGQPPRRLHPHEPTLVASEDVVDLGDGVLLTFEGMP